MYSSDHGELLGDFNKTGKATHHRSSVHIPLIISTPDMQTGETSDGLAELQDLAVTFTDLAGASFNSADDSYSLLDENGIKRKHQHSALCSGKRDWKIEQNETLKTVTENKTVTVYNIKNDPWCDFATTNVT